nr:DEAD/DEAH box helicase [Serpentinimonas raichei]
MANSSTNTGLWFFHQDLAGFVDHPTWTKGRQLFLNNRVLDLELEPDGVNWAVSGRVQGTQHAPYQTRVAITLNPQSQLVDWFASCSCPVGAGCKHAVALSIKAAYQGGRLLEGATPPPMDAEAAAALRARSEAAQQVAQTRLAQQAEEAAERQLLGWLQQVDAVDRLVRSNPAHLRTEADRREQYVYLVSTSTTRNVSRLQFSLAVSYPKLNGQWAKPRAVSYEPQPGYGMYDSATALDHQVLQLMRACKSAREGRAYGFVDTVLPMGEAGALLLRQAASTGRLLTRSPSGYPERVLAWGEPEPLQWAWSEVPAPDPAPPGWRLQAALVRPGLLLCANEPPLYLDAAVGVLGLVVADGVASDKLQALLKAPVLAESVLRKHADLLTQRLGPLPLPPVLPSVMQIKGLRPTACLHLSALPASEAPTGGLMRGLLRFDYAGFSGFWPPAQSAVMLPPLGAEGQRRMLHRDLDTEQQALARLLALGLWVADDGQVVLSPAEPPQRWLQWADSDWAELRGAGFELEFADDLRDWVVRADTLQVALEAQGEEEEDDEGGSPWFDLSLGIEINGARHNVLPWLPEIIATAARSPLNGDTGLPELPEFLYLRTLEGSGFVRLPSQSLRPWLGALLELVGERTLEFNADKLQLSRMEALRTSAALGEGVVWQGAQSLRALVQRMQGQQSLPVVALPASVQASLRPYQQLGLNWLQFLRESALAGILADDMGLGKTLQTLAHIQVEKDAGRLDRPALIIAPLSLLGNWQREAGRFCPDLRCLVLHGQERHEKAASLAGHDVVIAPYSLLQRDRERWLQTPWHLVVLDEAQNIKNASTRAAQVACELVTRHRLCLSGTPMENHLGEIWSLFHFLMPGFLSGQQRFKELFRNPIERQGNPERMAQLRARITPFMLRRTKALVAHELPPKVETVARVELSGRQADLYETIRLSMEKTVREALDSKGLAKSQITILDALLKLRQVCCDPQLLKLDAARKVKHSAKLEHLMELLPEMLTEGRRVLLFSQFTSMLSLIEVELKKRGLPWVKLTGQSQKRDQIIERFTSGEVPLFLISLKAGGVGLNLPQADTVIHYDPWWNPAVENQATDRAHRIGQTHSVWVLKLVAQGTIEERILALQERKAALAEGVYSGSAARREPLFGESDLAELLKPLGRA